MALYHTKSNKSPTGRYFVLFFFPLQSFTTQCPNEILANTSWCVSAMAPLGNDTSCTAVQWFKALTLQTV